MKLRIAHSAGNGQYDIHREGCHKKQAVGRLCPVFWMTGQISRLCKAGTQLAPAEQSAFILSPDDRIPEACVPDRSFCLPQPMPAPRMCLHTPLPICSTDSLGF